MKTIFDRTTSEELIDRLNKLDVNSKPQWGKMNAYQMMKHCIQWEDMMWGKKQFKRVFLGRLFGKMVLKKLLKDESPMTRNAPTVPEFVIRENGDALSERAKWIAMIKEHAQFSNDGFVHPFFGKMTKEQIGYLAYKHIDHHLRQFNC